MWSRSFTFVLFSAASGESSFCVSSRRRMAELSSPSTVAKPSPSILAKGSLLAVGGGKYHQRLVTQERIQDFIWGGGGCAKDCAYAQHEREAGSPLRQGSRVLEALRFLMHSCAIWALLSILIQNAKKKHSPSTFLLFFWGGGGGMAHACCAPFWICHCVTSKWHYINPLRITPW